MVKTISKRAMPMARHLYAALCCLMPLAACKRLEKDTPPAVEAAIAGMQQKYCPDPRLCVFDIEVQTRGANLRLAGEVSDAAAKREIVQSVKAAVDNFKVEEEIRLLPDEALGDRRFGVVRVSVANLRSKPAHTAELVHQQLLGSVLRLMKQEGNWYYVQTADGYLAWAPAGSIQITDSAAVAAWRAASLVAFKATSGVMRAEPNIEAAAISALVLGCVTEKTAEIAELNAASKKKWLQLALPDGRTGCVERDFCANVSEVFPLVPRPPEHIIAQAMQFLGIPYLWGGTSVAGFDCSGFTQTVFRLNGIALLRDASQQARQGERVHPGDDFANLRPADLLFFGDRPGKITHVAISLGGARFIHASDFVQINSLYPGDSDYADDRRRTFQFAKRFFGQDHNPAN